MAPVSEVVAEKKSHPKEEVGIDREQLVLTAKVLLVGSGTLGVLALLDWIVAP